MENIKLFIKYYVFDVLATGKKRLLSTFYGRIHFDRFVQKPNNNMSAQEIFLWWSKRPSHEPLPNQWPVQV